jgi:cell fate regulator YaaT (PSP1 superfamily)
LARTTTYNKILNKQKQWRDTNQNQEQTILLNKTNEDENIIHTIQWDIDMVCVDIDGTLIQKGKLNVRLVKMMHQYIQDGKYVFVFTNGNPDRNTERLMMAGLDDIFLPVISKRNMQERELAIIIDDVPPEKENLNCRQYIDPHSFI